MGNPILGDDGVGVRIAERVERALPAGAAVDVSEACVGGLSLMERMVGYERVILVDALCSHPVRSGLVRKLTLDDLREMGWTQHVASAHDTNLLTALEAGKRMSLPLPEDITVYAVEAENILDFGEELTPEVAAAIPAVVGAILGDLKDLIGRVDSTEGRKADGLT
jgi:hydrogenase maturation protease